MTPTDPLEQLCAQMDAANGWTPGTYVAALRHVLETDYPADVRHRLALIRERVVDDAPDDPPDDRPRTVLTCRKCKRRGTGPSDRVVYTGRSRLFQASPTSIPQRQYETTCQTCGRTFWTLARPS